MRRASKQDLAEAVRERYGRAGRRETGRILDEFVTATAGKYPCTLTMVDIATGWTECRALAGKGQDSVYAAITEVRGRLPFSLLGLDSDNGSEFRGEKLLGYCQRERLTSTRCRAYRKNDQAHVEQKNWSVVRREVGYGRYERAAALAQLWRLLLQGTAAHDDRHRRVPGQPCGVVGILLSRHAVVHGLTHQRHQPVRPSPATAGVAELGLGRSTHWVPPIRGLSRSEGENRLKPFSVRTPPISWFEMGNAG